MKTKRFAALPTIVAIAVAAHPNMAQAIDRTVADGQTETATQTLTGFGDTLSIEAGGAVSTNGGAVVMDAANQTLTNRGTIDTDGTSAYGVHSTAINAEVANFSGIITYADCAYGIYSVADYFAIINNGTISTRGNAGSYGIYVEYADHAAITNNGLIDTIGDTANGITLWGSHARITNNGTLTTSGANAIGIYAWHDFAENSQNVLTNTGTIRTTGTGSQAIYANATGMTVINSGRVASRHAEAFYMGQADQMLTLLAGSVIEGGIRFDQAGSATLNIGRGLDARLTLDGIPDTIDTNGQAYVLDGNVLTVVSSEANRAGGTAAAVTSDAVASALRSHISRSRQGQSGGGAAPLGYAPTPAAPDFPEFAPSDDFSMWTSAYGAVSSPRGGKAGVRTGQGGGLFGFDARLSEERLVGLFGGLGHGVVRADNGSKVETTTLVGGGYGSFGFGPGFVDVNAAIGATFNKSNRKIVNNVVAGGLETADGDYGGIFISPSVTVGLDHDLGTARLTPSISLLYAGIYQNGYTETGSTANLTLESQTTHVFTARGEIELGTLKLDEMAGGWSGSVRLGAEGTLTDGSATSASLLGSALNLAGSTSTEARGFVGMDFGFTRGGYDFSTKGEVGYSTAGVLSASIQGGIGMRF
ncbi:autotransporter domain-containing protein [Mesorhizobium sp. ANAO-SY3R2]|uniref:autotransporter outer membrane beta-barrel domain-containing protein n=1 Tax=Mesorhizobium sp. ANAO-SY3R2 TaxID=3166644 RepID=UPI00366AD93B